MISFSKNIQEEYEHFPHITLVLLPSGCDGNSFQILPQAPKKLDEYTTIGSNLGKTTVWISTKIIRKINGGFFTKVKNKIIFSHPENILTRCGCGRSFSFKSGNEVKDKIILLRKKLKQKSAHHHEYSKPI